MPSTLEKDHVYHFETPFEELNIEAKDGIPLNALYFFTPNVRKGVVLYFHGNAGHLQDWGNVHPIFTNRGYDLLISDYRSYGKTPGPIKSEASLYEDAEVLYTWLRKKYDAEEIIVYGRSLGTAVASGLASRVPARKLILETPFNTIPAVIKDKAPFLFLPFKFSYEMANDQHLQEVSCPTYIFQGTEDRIIPYHLAKKLKPLLKSPKAFITITGGNHNNLALFSSYHEHLDIILGIDEE